MGLEYKLQKKTGYLLMVFQGFHEPSFADVLTSQVLNVCKTEKPSKLLMDLRKVKGEMSTTERYYLAVTAATKYLGAKLFNRIPGCRFAIVGNHPLVDPGKFEENVAVNRGLNVRTFIEMKDALIWLEVEPAKNK